MIEIYKYSYTNTQLKQALAKMLPEKVTMRDSYLTEQFVRITTPNKETLCWNESLGGKISAPVLDTELLHLCWLMEETLPELQALHYNDMLNTYLTTQNYYKQYHATWQQRVIALCKVKGIEI